MVAARHPPLSSDSLLALCNFGDFAYYREFCALMQQYDLSKLSFSSVGGIVVSALVKRNLLVCWSLWRELWRLLGLVHVRFPSLNLLQVLLGFLFALAMFF